MNSVQFLLMNKFSLLSDENQIKIKNLGRPLPDLKIEVASSSRQKGYKRQFNKSVYVNTKWICGCDSKQALFCFPCLLFGGDKSWTLNGFTDLSHLTQGIKRHEITKNHLSNQVSLAFLGNSNITSRFDWTKMQQHNEEVTKNRHVLSRIIDCIKFCGSLELPLRGHNESEVLRGLVNFSADLNNEWKQHLENSTISKELQNEILQCMLEVCRDEIAKEISNANYLAIMAAEIASKTQIAIVLRYVKNCKPVERFWGFIKLEKRDTETLTLVRSVLDPLLENNCNKLIAQSYDGAILSGSVHVMIKEEYPLAHFVHCYAQQLNLVMLQAASQNREVQIFFSNIDDVVGFFATSPQRLEILKEVVTKRTQRTNPTFWDFKSRSVSVIFENRESLIECMKKIQNNFSNDKVITQASVIEDLLKDEKFLLWLNIFHRIMSHVDEVFWQTRTAEIVKIKQNLEKFENSMKDIRDNINVIIKEGEDLYLDYSNISPKRKCFDETEQKHHIEALEVCDVITITAQTRFQFINHLVALTLFSPQYFEIYSRNFPRDALKTTISSYPVLEANRLETELSTIYSRTDLRDTTGPVAFLQTITKNNLAEVFKETVKLLEILITIPMTTEGERSFSTLKRARSFLRNTVTEDGVSALSMLSIEKCLARNDGNFNEKVIEKFANFKELREDLI